MIVSRTFTNLASLKFTLYLTFLSPGILRNMILYVFTSFFPAPHPRPSIDYKCTKGKEQDLAILTFLRVSILVSHMQKAPINVDELNRTNLPPPLQDSYEISVLLQQLK